MLEQVDEAIEAWLRAEVPLSAQDVDVSFEPPEEEWSAKLNRPTVSVFLWDVRRSVTRARSGTEIVERDGVTMRRLALPRIELKYLVTVWTSDHGDERALMSGLLRSVLSYSEIPVSFMPEAIRHLPPMTVFLVRADEPRQETRNLDDRFKTGLNIVVTTALETYVGTPVGPPSTEFDFRLSDGQAGHADRPPRRVAGEILDPTAVGAEVTTPRGFTTVNAAGRFLVLGVTGDELVVHTVPPRSAVVPAEGGVRFL